MTIDATAGGRLRPNRNREAPHTHPPRRLARTILTIIWISLVAMMALGALLERNVWTALLFAAHAVFISPPLARAYQGPAWLRMTIIWSVFAAGLTVLTFSNDAAPVMTSGQPAEAKAAPETPQTEAERIQSDESEFVDLQIQAKEQLGAILKDPDSAHYQNVVAISQPGSRGHVSFCGQVNAKNSYGGYTGYTRFIVVPRIGAWLRNSPGIKFGEVWRAFCRNDYVIRRAPGFN